VTLTKYKADTCDPVFYFTRRRAPDKIDEAMISLAQAAPDNRLFNSLKTAFL
jgi:hypothetical protein